VSAEAILPAALASDPPPSGSGSPESTRPCTVTVVDFDFTNKVEKTIDFGEARAAIDAGRFVWVDIEASDPAEAHRLLRSLEIIDEETIDDALRNEPATRHARYEQYIHLVLSGCRQRQQQFDLERVDAIIAEHFLATVHRGPVAFLKTVRRDYRYDFLRFAKSPSFLVYELWDHLLDNYLAVQKLMEERVEELQLELSRDDVDDAVFRKISELGADLLHFRKVLLPARAVLVDLSSRRSLFISEATQPFLANMVGTLEHVLQDLLVDRDILSESLNLYMSLVSHRTNEVMKRLTVVSVIFLPLTFLCGVYGMNFEVIPELHWRSGYALFWALVLVIVGSLLYVMRRARLL
jgi:magnesium transporter